MQVITTLLNEHRLLYARFDELEQMLPTFTALSQLQRQVAPLGVALQRHVVLEEKVLFTALAPHLSEINPLAIMRGEHDGIDHLLAALLQTQAMHKAYAGVQFLLEVARMHCAREEQLLYSPAQSLLSNQEFSIAAPGADLMRLLSLHDG